LRYALYRLAENEGVIFHLKTQAVNVDPNSGIVTISNGEKLYADLIIGADGFYSLIRKYVIEDEEMEEGESSGIERRLLISCVSLPQGKLSDDETLRPLFNPSLVCRAEIFVRIFCSLSLSGLYG